MKSVSLGLALTFALISTSPLQARYESAEIVLSRAAHAQSIGDRQVSFIARDLETGTSYVLEGSEPDRRRGPWSTFKIPNLVIALETGAAESLDTELPWDSEARPPAGYWPEDWRQDQTLRTAFTRSAAWAFQDLAVQIGSDTYQDLLPAWAYGDAEVADGSDKFWLDHTLEISPREQISFLEHLLNRELGVSEDSLAALNEVSLAGQRPDGELHGKTGAGPVVLSDQDGRYEGWYVGYLVRETRAPIVFALHAEASSFNGIRTFRREMAEEILFDVTALAD
ncbi:penicillin-binding transpeptidase domain-containing protein [Oceanicaulis sp. LC35]|uniref:penicillin-binding transpeptidase domain-containing protein n=1 Tax=Oceanicaulis sp. LC35 TaxID=3349635 RepID=UPI003F82449C